MSNSQRAFERYQSWNTYEQLPVDLRHELNDIEGDEQAIEARFGHDLDFGTGGLRGIMGAGMSRMNVYTIRRATRALAEHVLAAGSEWAERGVAIGFDCRHNSELFAQVAGCTLAAAGVKAYVSPFLCPTPELSWAVRSLGAAAGIMITASHNPPEYNGYKVYNRHGGQILEDDATDIRNRMMDIDDVFAIETMAIEEATAKGLYVPTPGTIRTSYLDEVVRQVKDANVSPEHRAALNIVYTPLHGTGLVPVREVLAMTGYPNVFILPVQAHPDGNFTTVQSPNPEEPEALHLAIDAANQQGADLVMGTDPDADRVGIAVRNSAGDLTLLTGNQVGALLVDYYVTRHGQKQMENQPAQGQGPAGLVHEQQELSPIVFKTIVTSDFGGVIAKAAGVAVEDTLTGFKYIGDKMTEYEEAHTHRLLVGYEESYGYLVSPIVRDKDAVQACLAIAEMASFHKAHGRTLIERLEELYQAHGYYAEKLMSIALEGEDGVLRMQRSLESLREHGLEVPGMTLAYVEDYLLGERRYLDIDGAKSSTAGATRTEVLTLPKSDVQKFVFEGGHWAAVRPSGTEPKMKVYVSVRGRRSEETEELLARMVAAVQERVR